MKLRTLRMQLELRTGSSRRQLEHKVVRQSKSMDASHAVEVKSDQEILKRAMQDISTIRDVLSSRKTRADLKDTLHLRPAYQQYMQKMRLELRMGRLWEDAPHSEVCAFSRKAQNESNCFSVWCNFCTQ